MYVFFGPKGHLLSELMVRTVVGAGLCPGSEEDPAMNQPPELTVPGLLPWLASAVLPRLRTKHLLFEVNRATPGWGLEPRPDFIFQQND